MVDLKGIHLTYKQGRADIHALKNIDFQAEKGNFITIQGKSGSGKSSLLKVVGLIEKPQDGEYLLDGESVLEKKDGIKSALRNEKISFITQEFSLIEESSVEFNAFMPLYIGHRFDRKTSPQRLHEILQTLGMEQYLKTRVNQLSGGERQRVAIARALIADTELVLADEPTGSLDSRTGQLIMDTMRSIHQQGKTILMVTHDSEYASLGNIRLQMKDGEIL